MIDIHNHILPRTDDGAQDIEESLKMAAIAEQDGISDIIATPHLFDRSLRLETIIEKTIALNDALRAAGTAVRVHPGAEIPVHMLDEDQYRIGLAASEYLLVEFPFDTVLPLAGEMFRRLTQNGYKIIIAHPERNLGVMRNPHRLLELLGTDVSVQITAGSLTGDMGKNALSLAKYLLKMNRVAHIATDAHNAIDRAPLLSGALAAAERYLKQPATALVTHNPEKILRHA